MEDSRGKGGRAFEEKRTRTVRDLERNESLLAIIESMAVNHRDPQENKFLEGNREGGEQVSFPIRDRFISGLLPDDRVTGRHAIKLFIRVHCMIGIISGA